MSHVCAHEQHPSKLDEESADPMQSALVGVGVSALSGYSIMRELPSFAVCANVGSQQSGFFVYLSTYRTETRKQLNSQKK